MSLNVKRTLQFHIIPFFLSIVICFSSFSFPVFASDSVSVDYISSVVDYWDFEVDLFQRNVLDCLHRFDLYLNVCSGADSNGLHDFALQNIDGTHSQMVCQYCGLTAAEVYGYADDDYISSLDSTAVSTSYGVTGFSVTAFSSASTSNFYGGINYLASSSLYNAVSLLEDLGICDKVLVYGVGRYSPYYLVGYYFDSSGRFCVGFFTNPLGYAYYGLLGVYNYSDLSLVSYCYPYRFTGSTYYTYPIYYSTSYAENIYSTSGYVYAFDFSSSSDFYNGSSSLYCRLLYRDFSTTSYWTSNLVGSFTSYGSGSSFSIYQSASDYVVWDNSLLIPVYGNYSSILDRSAPIFNYTNTYNTTYNYTDDSEVVNYYIGTLDESTNEYNIYNLNLYDEDALIFTEPVTETQYQTTGWTYDYITRTYTLDLDSGTFYIGSYDIDTIDLTYGDEELSITYYSDGTAIATDEYAYLMVSQSECALNGHTYSLEDYQAPSCGEAGYYDYVCSVCGNEYLETIDATGEHSYEYSVYQEPTCTAEGTGIYTCSVCGNQYTEPIAATGHSYEYSIYQEPTCTATGIGIYTCSECGDQYTETIDPTGHTAEIVEYVATEYDEDGTATTVGYTVYECSVCGAQWTEADEIDVTSESWFSTISSLFKTLISALVNGLADGLNYLIENVIVSITDFVIQIVEWLFNLIDFDYLTSWFSWFDDNEVLDEEFGTSGDSYDVWNYS